MRSLHALWHVLVVGGLLGPAAAACGNDALDTGADVSSADDTDVDPPREVGRVTLRRLNRLEYNNTVRDLLGTALHPADAFPEDDLGYGYDNNGDVLSTSTYHIEVYLQAAEDLIAEALDSRGSVPIEQSIEAETLQGTNGAEYQNVWLLWDEGELRTEIDFPRAGTYAISAVVSGTEALGERPDYRLVLDNLVIDRGVVTAERDAPQTVTADVVVAAGRHGVAVATTNAFMSSDQTITRFLFVDRIDVSGPIEPPAPNPARERILFCRPATPPADDCTADVLRAFAGRAWRRPASDAEVDRLVALAASAFDDGNTAEQAIGVALVAVLVSPHFLYRPELPVEDDSGRVAAIDDYALASRLSYFLWASMPDDELISLAARNALHEPDEIDRQVRRMLRDGRAWGLVEGFAAQWLPIRAIDQVSPDQGAYPAFDEELRASMRHELELFVWHLVLEDRPITEIVDADYTFVNERLARHYGLSTASLAASDLHSPALAGSPGWYRVPSPPGRRGVLGQAGLLAALSMPARSSPVKRGKWIMASLLCDAPDAPPPGIPTIDNSPDLEGMTVRERMEVHRQNPACAGCHVVMDQLGFGLDHFDGVGAWRDEEDGRPVDASGDLPDGRSFDGALELADLIAASPEFKDCFAQQVSTWALGRGPLESDAVLREQLLARFAETPGRLSDMLSLVAQSPAFVSNSPATEH